MADEGKILAPEQLKARADDSEKQQDEYQREYELQMRRMTCSGCGEFPVH
jgi:hypothetical protein